MPSQLFPAEMTRAPSRPGLHAPYLPWGGNRSFIEDNDTLALRGRCVDDGFTLGFGDCAGKVIPALSNPYERN